MEHDVLQDDPQLVNKRNSLVRTAGRRLAEANMVIFDEINNKFHITDLGRIAAKYYLKHETVDVFSESSRNPNKNPAKPSNRNRQAIPLTPQRGRYHRSS